MNTELQSASALNQSDIYAQCVRTTYKARLKNLVTHIFSSLLPLSVGLDDEVLPSNILLVSALWIYTGVSAYFTHQFNTSPPAAESMQRWGTSLYFQMAGLGILYNLIYFNLHWLGVEHAMLYLLMTTALLSSGAVSSYHYQKGLGPIFVIFAIAPQILYYLSTGVASDVLLALLGGIFITFMSINGLGLHKNAVRLLQLNNELKNAKETAERLAMTDVLSGLNNRRSFFERGESIFNTARRYGHATTVLMLDIDRFKAINDTHGHAAGDEVIKVLAGILRHSVRDSDIVGRIGGEEFAIILPDTNTEAAQDLCERMLNHIRRTAVRTNGLIITYTASIGIASRSEKDHSLDELVAKADQALYLAKKEGRDRTAIYEAATT